MLVSLREKVYALKYDKLPINQGPDTFSQLEWLVRLDLAIYEIVDSIPGTHLQS
jgi:hypothetical protein